MNKKIEISKLIIKANSVLGGRDLQKEFIETCAIKLERHGVETVRHVLDKWVEDNKFMPKLCEFKKKCEEFDKRVVGNKISPAETFCRYREYEECEYSRGLCKKKNLDECEIVRSQRDFGESLCSWHWDVKFAKLNPDSELVKKVEDSIALAKRAREVGVVAENYESFVDFCRDYQEKVYKPLHNAPKNAHKGSLGGTFL